MTETERAKLLAEAHWSYVELLLKSHNVGDAMLKLIGFHYKSAMIHGHRHGVEDERGGMFRPSIGEPLTAEEVNAITHPCTACLDEKKCGGGLRQANGDCLHHRQKVLVRCEECSTEYCFAKVLTPIVCANYRPRVADQQHPRKEG